MMALSEEEFIFLLFLFTDECDNPVTLNIAALSSLLPYQLNRPYLSSSSLLPGGANYFFSLADSSSLEKACCLDRRAFDLLHDSFSELWQKPMSNQKITNGHLLQRVLTSQACLGITLHWLAHGPTLTSLCLFVGKPASTTSRYLQFGLETLFHMLQQMKSATLAPPSHQHLKDIGNACGSLYGEVMTGCAFLTDGSIHPLEKDANAQWNFFHEENHPGNLFSILLF